MIPNRIHYCWFGGKPLSKLAQKCLSSWKKYCPDYEIIEWNDKNFDVYMNDYTRFTYEHHLYAYLSDYVRLWAVEKYGGLYFDTDVELISNTTELQNFNAYFGFESNEYVNTGIGFGAIPHHKAILKIMKGYESKTYKELEDMYNEYHSLVGSPKMNTYPLIGEGLIQNGEHQQIYDAEILPVEYLCPYDDLTGELKVSDCTVSIHWYSKSANSRWAAIKIKFTRPIRRIIKRINKNG